MNYYSIISKYIVKILIEIISLILLKAMLLNSSYYDILRHIGI